MKRFGFIFLVITVLLSGCSQDPFPTATIKATETLEQSINTPEIGITAEPSPTATLYAPGADGVATAYLRAWRNGDFMGMYSLLSRTSQSMLDKATFEERYRDAQTEARVLEVETRPLAILQNVDKAEVAFQLVWKTALVGDIEREMTMPLVYEDGRWAVSWSDALILPEMGGGNRLQLVYQIPVRANIYDRNGSGLAIEGTAVTIGVVPQNIGDREQDLLYMLSMIFNQPADDVHARYADVQPDWYVPLGDAPQDAVSPYIENLQPFIENGGLQLQERKTRLYRDGGIAPHVVGYTNAIPAEALDEWLAKGYQGDERVGLSGLESWGEQYLGGGRGGTLYLVSPNGDRIGTIVEKPAQSNRSIYATIDKELQGKVADALADAIQTHPDGHAGVAVVMDVNTGQILALASYPDFNPNYFDPINPASASGIQEILNNPGRPLVNRVTQGGYPPGSVFKIVTMSAALISGAYLPETRYTCTGVWDRLGPSLIKTDWLETGHGNISLRQALTYSCDPYFYDVGYTLDQVDSFLIPDTARAFGFGQATGILGLHEIDGIIPDPEWKMDTYNEGWGRGDSVNMAIGQGFVVATPLQVVRMLAAVANGGTLYRPQVVQRIGEGGGAPEETLQPEVVGQIPITADQLAVIQQSLYGVTTETGGTAVNRFTNLIIPVAGKTGTSEVPPIYRDDGTLNDEPTAWFAGYAPAMPTPSLPDVPDEPEIAIVVMIENAGEGSDVAAPVVRRIVELYYGIETLTSYPW
ncbi:MAG: hypothetical protein JXA42_04705 [Anaerolineales bacterium]|nr:hypothetical protein [Anaerolineales bacterium]